MPSSSVFTRSLVNSSGAAACTVRPLASKAWVSGLRKPIKELARLAMMRNFLDITFLLNLIHYFAILIRRLKMSGEKSK